MHDNNFLKNSKQEEAISYTEGPLLVLAGAGTGKTLLLVNRIAYIINQNLARPSNILAVTFTNKAAKEMVSRLNLISDAEDINIGTFHSIALSILRENVDLLDLGFSRYFSVVDQIDQIKLVKNIMLERNIDVKKYSPKLIHYIISRWKDQCIFFDKLTQSDVKNDVQQIAASLYKEYQRQLGVANAMDFSDLLLYCNRVLMDNPLLLQKYQDKFRYVLIDEYQDTNIAQYLFVRMIANKHKNICCVGDDDQSIYSWRGAEIGNILRFEHDFPNAKIVKLEQNYRSTRYILDAAACVIRNNSKRHDKTLWTDSPNGEKIRIHSFWNDKEEARYIASQIHNFISSKKYSADDMAVLVRAGFQSRVFEEVFINSVIPYQIIGNVKFYERAEIKDTLSYIRLSINLCDNISLERIINSPRRSIGDVTLEKIKVFANDKGISMFCAIKAMINENLFKGKIRNILSMFVTLIETANARYLTDNATDVTKYILEQSLYISTLEAEKTDESKARIENINEMLRAINEFENIFAFIEHASLVMNNDVLEANFGGSVKIMTLHAAKGLEFKVVFLPGWEEGIFPNQKAIDEGPDNIEEERRIAYVGITRARDMLFITHSETRYMFSDFQRSTPSRFLSEIPKDLCVMNSYIAYASRGKKASYNEDLNDDIPEFNYSAREKNVATYTSTFGSKDIPIGNTINRAQLNVKQISDIKNYAAPVGGHSISGVHLNTINRADLYTSNITNKNGSGAADKINETNDSRKKVITHPRFGVGVVIKENGEYLEVMFKNIGKKTIQSSFVELVS